MIDPDMAYDDRRQEKVDEQARLIKDMADQIIAECEAVKLASGECLWYHLERMSGQLQEMRYAVWMKDRVSGVGETAPTPGE